MILRRLNSEAWNCSRIHADHFNNDCAYSSKGFILLYICHVNVLFYTPGTKYIGGSGWGIINSE